MISIRSATADDLALVFDAWVKSYDQSPLARILMASGQHYARLQDGIAKALVERGARIDVACLDDEPGLVVGWVCHREPTLHYVWTRKAFRGRGIARQLIEQAGKFGATTHWARDLHGLRLDQTEIFQCA